MMNYEMAESEPRIVHKTGLTDNGGRDYKIINRVRSISRTNDKYFNQHKSSIDLKQTVIPVVRRESSNWTERGTEGGVGGVLGIVKTRSSSRARSQSKTRKADSGDDRDDGEKKRFSRGRSSSRQRSDSKSSGFSIRRSLSRGLSKVRGSKKETKRGRSGDRRGGNSKNKLPPTAPGRDRPPRNNNNNLPPKTATDSLTEKEEAERQEAKRQEAELRERQAERQEAERQLIAEVMGQTEVQETENKSKHSGTDSLNDHDVMQLDKKNTTMHVACLLHRSDSDIIERLEDEPELAESSNYANESPLHYAAMDKKGVSKEVLKKLIRLNPEAVKQPNVQNSLPIHLACMIGAPSTYVIKTFLKMYPKATMIQTDFPLLFEDDMEVTDNDDDSEFVSHLPKKETPVSGIASMFAFAAPNQAAMDAANERTRKKVERHGKSLYDEERPGLETGFSPLHLAVMNSAKSSVIELLVKVSPRSTHLKTSRGRTALDCAQYIVRQHWLYGTDDEAAIQNTFSAIDILEAAVEEN